MYGVGLLYKLKKKKQQQQQRWVLISLNIVYSKNQIENYILKLWHKKLWTFKTLFVKIKN